MDIMKFHMDEKVRRRLETDTAERRRLQAEADLHESRYPGESGEEYSYVNELPDGTLSLFLD